MPSSSFQPKGPRHSASIRNIEKMLSSCLLQEKTVACHEQTCPRQMACCCQDSISNSRQVSWLADLPNVNCYPARVAPLSSNPDREGFSSKVSDLSMICGDQLNGSTIPASPDISLVPATSTQLGLWTALGFGQRSSTCQKDTSGREPHSPCHTPTCATSRQNG